LIPGAINNECVGFSIIEIEKLCKESTECKAEQAYVRNQKPPVILGVRVFETKGNARAGRHY
jgi:hypothetical protein